MTKAGFFSSHFLGSILLFMLPCYATAQNVPPQDVVVPPPRTITASLKPTAPSRIVDIHSFDDDRRSCVDTYKLESARVRIYAGQTVSFRTGNQRKCNGKGLNAPIPQSTTFSVRNTGGKKTSPDATQTIKPSGNSFSFTHTFTSAGNYQISVIHRINEAETYTISFTIQVLPQKINVPAPENTN